MRVSIYTQDKTQLIPYCEKIKIKSSYKGFKIIHGQDVLGVYKSKERALEVMKELINLIRAFHQFTNEKGRIVLAFPSTGEVYEMPEE